MNGTTRMILAAIGLSFLQVSAKEVPELETGDTVEVFYGLLKSSHFPVTVEEIYHGWPAAKHAPSSIHAD